MSDQEILSVDDVLQISDPGERNRENHVWGDRLMVHVGNVAAWLFPLLMTAIVVQVTIRKMGNNQAWLDDGQWWLYGAAMMAGFGYAITTESHVRVDVLHANFSEKKKAKIELFGLGWCLLPFLILMLDNLVHYGYSSFVAREGSDSPNGLHGLFLLKMLLPMLFVMAIIACFAVMNRHLKTLTKPALWSILIAAFPGVWFAAERAVHYVLWWIVRFTKPDINPRRIGREALLEPAIWYGLAIILILAGVSYLRTRRDHAGA